MGSIPTGMFHQPLDVLEGEDRYGLQNVWVVELIFILFSSFKYHILLSILHFKSRTHFNITCIFIGARPHCAAEIKNTALLLRLGLPFSLTRQKTQLYFYG